MYAFMRMSMRMLVRLMRDAVDEGELEGGIGNSDAERGKGDRRDGRH